MFSIVSLAQSFADLYDSSLIQFLFGKDSISSGIETIATVVACNTEEEKAGRKKEFQNSPEWKELQAWSNKIGTDLCCLPTLQGCGVYRHPSGCFWSCQYPARGWKTARWSDSTPAFKCLVKCIRQVIKWHLEAHPDAAEWANQLTVLGNMDT